MWFDAICWKIVGEQSTDKNSIWQPNYYSDVAQQFLNLLSLKSFLHDTAYQKVKWENQAYHEKILHDTLNHNAVQTM